MTAQLSQTREWTPGAVSRILLPPAAVAVDIGTGTGVLAALLARRGVPRIVGTDIEKHAVACARDNIRRDGADLVICNAPYLPATPTRRWRPTIYYHGGRTLTAFIATCPIILTDDGEGMRAVQATPINAPRGQLVRYYLTITQLSRTLQRSLVNPGLNAYCRY